MTSQSPILYLAEIKSDLFSKMNIRVIYKLKKQIVKYNNLVDIIFDNFIQVLYNKIN